MGRNPYIIQFIGDVMGIFDFFRKLVEEKKVEEIVSEKLAFSDIENWISRTNT